VAERPTRSWLVFALLATLLIVLSVVVTAPINTQQAKADIETQLEQQAKQGQAITPQQREMALGFATNPLFTTVLPAVGVVVMLWLGWGVWAAALYLTVTVMGGRGRFGLMWQAVVWSYLPLALRSLVQTGFVLATQTAIRHAGFSGYVTGTDTNSVLLATFLGGVDVFVLWNLILLIVGVSVTARVSKAKSVLVPLVVWILLALGGVGLAYLGRTMGSGLGG
jgi:hypothetical protein